MLPKHSLIPSRKQPSLTSVAENLDSSFHLVSIRQGNLANDWPRKCRTCVSWPRAPVWEARRNEEISLGPSVQSRAGKVVAFEKNGALLHPVGHLTASRMPKPPQWCDVTNYSRNVRYIVQLHCCYQFHTMYVQAAGPRRNSRNFWIQIGMTVLLLANCVALNRVKHADWP